MASPTDSIFVTYVDAFGDLLKIWGQRDRTCANYIEKQLMKSTMELNRMPGPPAGTIQKGMLCFAKCSDDKYYRGRITSDVFNNTVTVVFIDYGHKDRVDLSNIRLQNGSTDGVITTIVSQAEEFFLANVGSRGGWFPEVLNEIRRDLCYKEFNYTVKYQFMNERFIQINYHKEDYASLMLRRNLAVPVPVADQTLFLRYTFKSQEQLGGHSAPGTQANLMNTQTGSQMMPKFQQEQIHLQPHIPVNPMHTQAGFHNNMDQNTAFNKSNNNVAQTESKVTPMLNSVMIEALADQLKQHIFKDTKPTVEPTSHNYVTQVLEVGTTHSVYISHIDDGPWSFSIQLVSSEHEMNQLMDDLAACDLIPIKLPVVLGYPCIAKSKEYDNYCRGVVVNISHSAVKIFFVDFGNTEDLPVSSIFEIPVRFFRVKAMSQKFALSGLQKIKQSPEIKRAFVEVAENELLLLHVTTLEGENLPTCDLYLKNVNIKRILNEKVLQIRKWTPIQPPRQGEVEDVVVTWIDSPQKFYAQLKKNDRDLENLKIELAQWGANGEVINPDELVPGALCVCCFTGDNKWYRAIVTSINSKNSVRVFYVDYGNVEDVRPSEIKKIGNGLIRQMNTQAVQCCLHGFENRQTDPEIISVLEDLMLEKELCLKVVYNDRDHIVVKVFDKGNDISLSLSSYIETKCGEKRVASNLYSKYAAGDVKEETVINVREKTDAGSRRNDVKNRTTSNNNRPEDKSWRKKEERSPRSDLSSDGGWRSDDSKKDGKDERQKSTRYGFRPSRREVGNDDKNWRNRDSVDAKNVNEKRSERGKGQGKPKPAESIMERARRAAKETQEKGLKMSITRYPMKLENMALHGASFKGKHIPVGSVEEVIVTYFLNPNEIYVQLLSTKEDFRKVMDEIQDYYATKLPVANFPKKGDVVVAKFKGDDVLYRASVIDSNPLMVRYIDYGNEEVTERERLWPMDKKFLDLEAQAIKCSLPDIIPNGATTWPVPEEQIDKIFEYETYSCKFLNCAENTYEVLLTISENGKDVRDELISIGFALAAENNGGPAEGVKQCSSMDLTLMENETYKVNVSHVVGPSEFYVQVERDVISMVEEEVKKCGEAQESTPLVNGNSVSNGGLFLANIGGDKWRRVKIIKKTENNAIVQLIDYGDKLEVAYKQMKPLPVHLLEYPPQAVQCCLFSETKEYPGNIAEELKGCDKNVFIALIRDVFENRLRVTLYDAVGEKLEFLNDLNNEPPVRPITSFPITKQGIAVVPYHVTSPKEIYIQRLSDIPALKNLNAEMLHFYRSDGEDLEPGSKICAAKSIVDECWYRARVLMSAGEDVKVFYIDYGRTEKVPFVNIKKLNQAHAEKHAFCRRISLNVDYEPGEEAEISRKLSEMIAGKECVGHFVKVEDVMYGELFLGDGAVSDLLLSDKVKRQRDGMFGDVPAAKKTVEVTEKDSGVFISHVSSPSEFWIHHESISNELEAFQNMLQSACSNASPKKEIRVGDIVGALFTDQLWYRSMVLNVEEKVLLIQFIDYGNSLKINLASNEVVELVESVAKVPPFAIFCSLKGQWKGSAALRFEEIITVSQDPFTLVELEGENPKIIDLVQNGISVTEQLISEGYDAASGDDQDDYDVYITHINTPNDFYIQRNGDKHLFDTLISGLLEADLFEDVEDVKENEIYCAKFPENEMWYRAKVLKRNENSVHVHFIDFGNNCSVTDVKLLPPDFLIIPPLSLNCCLLYGQSHDTWSEAACKKFTEYVSNSAFRMEIVLQGARRSVVKLFTEEGENVTDVLEELCEPDKREEVCVTHINSPSDFYVQRADNEDYDVIDDRLKEGDTFEDLKKKDVGMLCAAKYQDGIWYRAELKKICDGGCEVFFIDYGNSYLSSELKSLPDDIKGIKPLAKNCCLDFSVTNIPESVKEQFTLLAEQTPVMRMHVVKPGDKDLVSLKVDGMKLEEVLLYTISVTCDIDKVEMDEENRIDKKTKTGNISMGDKFQTSHGYGDLNFEDDVRAGNETDEEKRVKFAIITSENTEGFRSDDEKGIMEGYGLYSSAVNVSDNELLEGAETETPESVNGEVTEEAVAEKSEIRLVESAEGEADTEDECFEGRGEGTSECVSDKEGETVTGKTACEPEGVNGSPEEAVVDDLVINSIETSSPQEKVDEDITKPIEEDVPDEKVALDEKLVSAAVNGTSQGDQN